MNNGNFDEADNLGTDGDDNSESDGSTDFAFTGRNQDEASFEQYSDIDVVGWPTSESLQWLADRLLFLLRAGCDPIAEDTDGFTICDYARKHHLSSTWHAALIEFDADRREIASKG